jgi:hypothetical protein
MGGGRVLLDGDAWCPVIEEGGKVLAALSQIVALDLGFDVVDLLADVVGGGLAYGLPAGFGDVEDGCEGVGCS